MATSGPPPSVTMIPPDRLFHRCGLTTGWHRRQMLDITHFPGMIRTMLLPEYISPMLMSDEDKQSALGESDESATPENEADSEAERLRVKIAELRVDMDTRLREANDEHGKTVAKVVELTDERRNLRAACDKWREQVAACHGEIDRLKRENEKILAEIDTVRGQRDAAEADLRTMRQRDEPEDVERRSGDDDPKTRVGEVVVKLATLKELCAAEMELDTTLRDLQRESRLRYKSARRALNELSRALHDKREQSSSAKDGTILFNIDGEPRAIPAQPISAANILRMVGRVGAEWAVRCCWTDGSETTISGDVKIDPTDVLLGGIQTLHTGRMIP